MISLIEVKLDNDLPYNFNRIWIKEVPFLNSPIEIQEIQFGPFINETTSNLNLSTCFDTVYVIPNDVITPVNITPIMLPKEFQQGCYGGESCTGKCKDLEECVNEWQRNRCICLYNYTLINGICTTNNRKYSTPAVPEKTIKPAYWWIILMFVICFLLLVYWIVIIIVLRRKCGNSSKPPKPFADISKTYENLVCYNDQAGESDYSGPPINFDLLKNVTDEKEKSSLDLLEKKDQLELKNKDLALDQPLQYEYEGGNSDLVSVSSLGSGSTDEELNVKPIETTNIKFAHLKNLYK